MQNVFTEDVCTRNYHGFNVEEAYVPSTCKPMINMHFVLVLRK